MSLLIQKNLELALARNGAMLSPKGSWCWPLSGVAELVELQSVVGNSALTSGEVAVMLPSVTCSGGSILCTGCGVCL